MLQKFYYAIIHAPDPEFIMGRRGRRLDDRTKSGWYIVFNVYNASNHHPIRQTNVCLRCVNALYRIVFFSLEKWIHYKHCISTWMWFIAPSTARFNQKYQRCGWMRGFSQQWIKCSRIYQHACTYHLYSYIHFVGDDFGRFHILSFSSILSPQWCFHHTHQHSTHANRARHALWLCGLHSTRSDANLFAPCAAANLRFRQAKRGTHAARRAYAHLVHHTCYIA